MPPLDNALEAFSRLVEFTHRLDIRPTLPESNPDPASQTTFDRILADPDNLADAVDENNRAAFIRRIADRIKRKLKGMPALTNPEPLFPSRGRGRGYGLDIPSEDISLPEE